MDTIFDATSCERMILSGLMAGTISFDDVNSLQSNDFKGGKERTLFERMRQFHERGEAYDYPALIDAVTVETEGNEERQKQEYDFLGAVMREVLVSAALASEYVTTIKRAAMRRDLSALAQSIAQTAQDPDTEPLQAIERHRKRLDDLMKSGPSTLKTMHDMWEEERARQFDQTDDGLIRTGLPSLDDELLEGGIEPGELLIIGARPAVGKSALALNIALNAAADGKRVLFVSTEMGAKQILRRIVSRYSDITVGTLVKKSMTELQKQTFKGMDDKLSKYPIVLAEDSLTLAQIRADAYRMHADGGLDLIVVDYLQQLIPETNKNYSRTNEVGAVSRFLKQLARAIPVPVIALSQLSRRSADNYPSMHDLRDSGEIEQDADAIMLLHQPDEDDLEDAEKWRYPVCEGRGMHLMHINIAKNRRALTGEAFVAFDGAHTDFIDFKDIPK